VPAAKVSHAHLLQVLSTDQLLPAAHDRTRAVRLWHSTAIDRGAWLLAPSVGTSHQLQVLVALVAPRRDQYAVVSSKYVQTHMSAAALMQ